MPNERKPTNSSGKVDSETLAAVIGLLHRSVVHDAKSNCWSSKLKVNGRGHVQIKYKNIKYLGHRVMACANSKPLQYVEYDPATKIEASHLCGNRACINPEHLHFENCLVNQTRDCCRMYGSDPRYWCPHEPKCIIASQQL